MEKIVIPADLPLPNGIRASYLEGVNGLRLHLLEAGFETPGRPCILLLHGFPELAYSWRKVMPALAAAGYYVVAPDQRGYGRTTGWDGRYDGDLRSFHLLNIVRDALALVAALGVRSLAAVVGHDFGAPVAAYCALSRPDIFRALVLMSAPFGGPPAFPMRNPNGSGAPAADIHAALAALDPPRKHYQWYYSTRAADGDMRHCPQGVHAFLRAYYHMKSADWAENRPFPLRSWTAAELAKLPAYYVMARDRRMAETVAPEMPSPAEVAACQWLTEAELRVYSAAFEATGFQGGLQWYRCATDDRLNDELRLFSGRQIDVPACFIAGAADWGVYQKPGDFEKMQNSACANMLACHLVADAGHWVQQEQSAEVCRLLIEFLKRAGQT